MVEDLRATLVVTDRSLGAPSWRALVVDWRALGGDGAGSALSPRTMTTTFDSVDPYEAALARRSARAKVLRAVAIFALVAAILGWRIVKLVHRLGNSAPAPAAVVRVADDGTVKVDGCASTVSQCLADARTAGARECTVASSAAAPDAARGRAMKACASSGMTLALAP